MCSYIVTIIIENVLLVIFKQLGNIYNSLNIDVPSLFFVFSI